MRVLGIETSCDDTAAAVVIQRQGRLTVAANVVQSQLEVHAAYGGVVPELASRAHIRHVLPVVATALERAGLTLDALDGIAVTTGPGLVGALLVGVATAQGLAMARGLPLIGVHHMEGHLLSPFLVEPDFAFPCVALLVSGGHTLLVHARGFGDYHLLGQSLDDSVGEAFDKGARLLGLGYPGGPAIGALAVGGDPRAVPFPRVLLNRQACDFSFSGLKTALRTWLEKRENGGPTPSDVAASYQEALVTPLVIKALQACRLANTTRLVVAGGVGANRRLREKLQAEAEAAGIRVLFPPLEFCTDNGAMIALAGLRRLALGQQATAPLDARPRWSLAELAGPVRSL
ncbi:MAG: tRNA (adenosine(37)-N6)-threonylcarbamoyltransferase complex transferase subunit TsaD [Magnetococcales bacterium]|nr:tRNA (adenosine(37)-N6)-threonylcarbamoyltransferase complex transferase subunit TsaD [Magnetococcales bacterium]